MTSETNSEITKTPSKRTWSRELSLAMIIGICVLIYFDKPDMVELVLWPVVAFALPSFGFKQPTLEAWMNKKK